MRQRASVDDDAVHGRERVGEVEAEPHDAADREPLVRIDRDPRSSPDAFELVVCYDVLQYLDDRSAARAMANLARLTLGVLYLSALTTRDWRENCDRTRTDRDVHLRDAAWYVSRLKRNFRSIGAGFWVRRGAPLVTWEMETALAGV